MKNENEGCAFKESNLMTFELPDPSIYEEEFIEAKVNTNYNESKEKKLK